MLLYANFILFVIFSKSFQQGLACNWRHGYSGHSRSKVSIGRVQNEIACNLRCNALGVNEDAYAEYNFDDKGCICHLQFIGMIRSNVNVALCKTEAAEMTAASFDVIHHHLLYSDLLSTNRSLRNHIIMFKEVKSLTECFRLCFKCNLDQDCNCLSANFSHYKVDNNYKCEINNATRFSSTEDFVKRIGFQYYEVI